MSLIIVRMWPSYIIWGISFSQPLSWEGLNKSFPKPVTLPLSRRSVCAERGKSNSSGRVRGPTSHVCGSWMVSGGCRPEVRLQGCRDDSARLGGSSPDRLLPSSLLPLLLKFFLFAANGDWFIRDVTRHAGSHASRFLELAQRGVLWARPAFSTMDRHPLSTLRP